MTDFGKLLLEWPRKVIRRQDLQNGLNRQGPALDAVIKRALKAEKLQRLKSGLYVIMPPYNKTLPNTYECAHWLYGTSYITAESALSYHGLIPEAVYTTVSATKKKSQTYDTFIGHFEFIKTPPQNFLSGVERIEVNSNVFFMASPFKAIADLIYLSKKDWKNLDAFLGDMRIEEDDFNNLDNSDLDLLIKHYGNGRVRTVLKRLENKQQIGG